MQQAIQPSVYPECHNTAKEILHHSLMSALSQLNGKLFVQQIKPGYSLRHPFLSDFILTCEETDSGFDIRVELGFKEATLTQLLNTLQEQLAGFRTEMSRWLAEEIAQPASDKKGILVWQLSIESGDLEICLSGIYESLFVD
jgi:hypothetical protein